MNNPHIYRAAAKQLGVLLGEIARERGYTGKHISETTAISETTISRIFKGHFCPKSEYLVAIADAIGVDLVFVERTK